MVNVRTKDGRSVLHSACASSNVDVVKRLLKAGVDVNVQSADGATPIARVSIAATKGILELSLCHACSECAMSIVLRNLSLFSSYCEASL